MKKIIITLSILLTVYNVATAQHARFVTSGTVEYEKSVNTYAILRKVLGSNIQGLTQQLFEQYQKTQPQFRVLKSTLTFNQDKTLFTPIESENMANNFMGEIPMADQKNTVYIDLSTGASTNQKGFFGETFLLSDTARKIKWKITDETREIAGYACRRANAVILDSVYVVAFYTNDIHVSGGPESFTGLPGMILEVALPHDNVTWRATKVNDAPVPSNTILPPKKGKAVNKKQFMALFNTMTKNSPPGKRADINRLWYLL